MTCSCNSYNEISSGGLSAGGAALVTVEQVEGGLVCGGSARVEVVTDVYDGVTFILPLDEDGTSYLDRTRNHLDGTGGGGTYNPTTTSGVFCLNAASFDASSNQYISIPADNLPVNHAFTVSCWLKIDTMFKTRRIYSRGYDTGSDKWVFNFGYSYINNLMCGINTTDGTTETNIEAYSAQWLGQDKFYHVGSVFDGSSLSLYVDGEQDGTNTVSIDGDSIAQTNGGFIGRFNQGAFHTGLIQELRLYPEAKSQAWLKAEHDNFCSSGFYSVGSEETL